MYPVIAPLEVRSLLKVSLEELMSEKLGEISE